MKLRTIKTKEWLAIRDKFSDYEKQLLNQNAQQTICPPGACVDLDGLSTELATKFDLAVKELREKD